MFGMVRGKYIGEPPLYVRKDLPPGMTDMPVRFFATKRPMLGRWCLHDTTKHSWKADMANIDHCGTCTLSKVTKATKETKETPAKEKKNAY